MGHWMEPSPQEVPYIQTYLLIMQCLLAGKSYFYAITFELQLEKKKFGRSLSVWGRAILQVHVYWCLHLWQAAVIA